MTRNDFEKACREQNAKRAAEVAEARSTQKPCSMTPMMAFGPGMYYCTAHGVMVQDVLGGGVDACQFGGGK